MKRRLNQPISRARKRFWVGIPMGIFLMVFCLITLPLYSYFRINYVGKVNRNNEIKLLSIANDAFRNKQYEKSKSFYEKVLKINPDNHDANYYLASLYEGYLTPHDLKKGLYYTQKALQSKKDDKELIYEARGLWENAQFYESEMIIREVLA